jgi:hypothetical protein
VLALAVAVGSLFLLPAAALDTPLSLKAADASEASLDRTVFFGESTTTHLAARGGLDRRQVWCDQSGTRMLSPRVALDPLIDPDTGNPISLGALCAREQPETLVLSFGLNGAVYFVAHKEHYLTCYTQLIDAVLASSPNTEILLQTVYPVARADAYSVSVDTLNAYLQTLNGWLPEIAQEYPNVRVIDTASVLRAPDGRLRAELADADGIHLLPAAYGEILQYLRTHARKS